MSLEELARLWFDRSPAQHAVIVRRIIEISKGGNKNTLAPSLAGQQE